MKPMAASISFSHPPLQTIHQTLLGFAPEAVLVGGAVRDRLLDRPVHDLDYVVEGNALNVGRKLADALDAAYYPLDKTRKIARIVWKQADETLVVDISSLIGMTLEEDIRRRDFTINAIAMLSDGQLFDLLGGAEDLAQRLLRLCSPDSLYNDPVRTIRAVRFLHLFELTPAPGMDQSVWYAAPRLHSISPERQRDEFVKILALSRPHLAVDRLNDWRIADELLPELVALQDVAQPQPHVFDVYHHSLQTLRWMSRLDRWLRGEDVGGDAIVARIQQRLAAYRPALNAYLQAPLTAERPRWLWLRFAAIAHDWGKARAFRENEEGDIHFYGHEQLSGELVADWMLRYHCAKNEISFVKRVCVQHMRPMGLFITGDAPSRRTLFRFYRDLDDAAPATILLFLADFLGARGKEVDLEELDAAVDHLDAYLQPFMEQDEKPPIPTPLLNGNDIIQLFDAPKGPTIGRLISALQEAQAAGEVETREQAIGYIENLLETEDND
jgi:tRNA nucleotidyltransferase/poly(A) polymerase